MRAFVQIEIDIGRGAEFDAGEALVEMARLGDALEHLLRHGRAGLGVAREGAENFRLQQPMLIELRRQLDEIARDAGAGDERIGDVRQHAVQRMAELVEQSARVVEAEQRRRAIGALARSSAH